MHLLVVPTEETHRRPDGERWCFVCRKHRAFDYVVLAPLLDRDRPLDEQANAWYPPTPQIECATCKTVDGDCFPGTTREWEGA